MAFTVQQKVQCCYWLAEFKCPVKVQIKFEQENEREPPEIDTITAWHKTLLETGSLVINVVAESRVAETADTTGTAKIAENLTPVLLPLPRSSSWRKMRESEHSAAITSKNMKDLPGSSLPVHCEDTALPGGEMDHKKPEYVGGPSGVASWLAACDDNKSWRGKYVPSSLQDGGNKKGDTMSNTRDIAEVACDDKKKSWRGNYVPPSLQDGGNKRGDTMSKTRDIVDTTSIKVSNLSESTTDRDLEDLVKPFGPINKLYLAKDDFTYDCKGFGYIRFKFRADAAKACFS